MKYLPWAVLLIALVAGYGWHQKRVGILEGEIKARGVAIQQLSRLASQRDVVYRDAKAKYLANPTPEGCSLIVLACDQRDSTRVAQIGELNAQVAALTKRGKPSVLSHLPWVLGGVVAGFVLTR